MAGVFEIMHPWVAIVLACGTIAYGLYVTVSTKPRSKSRKNEAAKSDDVTASFISEKLDSVVALLDQINRRLESMDAKFGKMNEISSQAKQSRIISYTVGLGQLRRTAR